MVIWRGVNKISILGNSTSMWRSLEGYRSQRKGQVSVSETERTAHTKPKAGKSWMHFRTNKRVNVFESWNKECVTEVGYRQDHSGLEGHSKVWILLSVTGKHCGFSPSNIVWLTFFKGSLWLSCKKLIGPKE